MKCSAVRGTSQGTRSRPFFCVARRGNPLPPITLFRVWLEPAVDLRHHRHVAVPELPCDQLEQAGAGHHPCRPMVAGVMQPVALQAERPEPLAVRLRPRPARVVLPGGRAGLTLDARACRYPLVPVGQALSPAAGRRVGTGVRAGRGRAARVGRAARARVSWPSYPRSIGVGCSGQFTPSCQSRLSPPDQGPPMLPPPVHSPSAWGRRSFSPDLPSPSYDW